MQFDSFTFLLFFITVLILYQLIPNWRGQKILLLISSYLFYAAWSPPLIILIWISTLADFFIAKSLPSAKSEKTKKYMLFLSLAINLGMLGYFKYAEFLVGSFHDLLNMAGIVYSPPSLDIILPIGISFYTFQTLSYTMDVYRGKLRPTDSLLDFSLFVTFFPQLVAGPIVRADHFLPQCEAPKRIKHAGLIWGLTLIAWGLFQKKVLADSLFSPLVDNFYSGVMNNSIVENWLNIFSFSMQIYCDFSGYSLCAVGAAIALGFSIPDNFNSPYAARGFSDFWHRWHITLSTWLRDYLYIPLGGSKHGHIKTLRNLIITMGLGGLWHGANWNFAIWGLLHGSYLVAEHQLQKLKIIRIPWLLVILMTFVTVSLSWIPFRSPDLNMSVMAINSLFNNQLPYYKPLNSHYITAIICFFAILAYQIWRRNKTLDELMETCPIFLQAGSLPIAILLIALCATGDRHAFIYFQF